MKVVLNKCYGGFVPSHEAVIRYAERKGIKVFPYIFTRVEYGYEFRRSKGLDDIREYDKFHQTWGWGNVLFLTKDRGPRFDDVTDAIRKDIMNVSDDELRFDPDFIATVEEMGHDASTYTSELRVIEFEPPEGFVPKVIDNDGMELLVDGRWCW